MRPLSMISVAVLLSSLCAAAQTETLRSIKQKYLNKTVVIKGHVYVSTDRDKGPTLSDWGFAYQDGDRYKSDPMSDLPAVYKGRRAVVIAIQLHELEPARVNAVGEQISADDTVDPYFDLVVRFDDGKLALTIARPFPFTQRTAEQVIEYTDKVYTVVHQIHAQRFYKRPGKWRRQCEFLPVCVGDMEKAEQRLVRIV